jgi:hypothetical protein
MKNIKIIKTCPEKGMLNKRIVNTVMSDKVTITGKPPKSGEILFVKKKEFQVYSTRGSSELSFFSITNQWDRDYILSTYHFYTFVFLPANS